MIKATVKAGAEFQQDQPVTVQKLNALGTPTVDISGTVESEDIATEAVTNAKLQQETETTDGAVNNAVVADDAAISLSKLEGVISENIVAGNSEGKAKAHELVGDVSLTRARKVPFDGGTVTVGMKIRIKGTDNVSHLGEVVKVDGYDAFYKPTSEAHGDIQNDSAIHNQPATLVYSPDNQAVTVGDTVSGAGGASGIVKAINSETNTLTLRSVSGFFVSDESLTVDNVSVGNVASDSGYEIVAYVNGDNASVLTDVLVSTVSESEDIGTTVRVEDIKPTGTSGQVLTSNGSADAPSFQAVNVQPAVALGHKDTQYPTGDKKYAEAEIVSVSGSNVLSSTSGDANKDFQKFSTGDAVIFTGENAPTGASLYTIYYIKRETDNTAKIYETADQAEAGGTDGQVLITAVTTNSVLCRSIASCEGKVGGFLFPDRNTHRDIARRYCVVFNSTISKYVLTGSANQIYSHDAEGEDETPAEKGIIVPIDQKGTHVIFDAMYLYGNSTSYSFRYLSLLVTQY